MDELKQVKKAILFLAKEIDKFEERSFPIDEPKDRVKKLEELLKNECL